MEPLPPEPAAYPDDCSKDIVTIGVHNTPLTDFGSEKMDGTRMLRFHPAVVHS